MQTVSRIEPRIEASWKENLLSEFESAYFQSLRLFLKNEKSQGKVIYPPGEKIFAAFDACSFNKTSVVIIGQDPYHGKDQANGLAFSVNKGLRIPPSLQNIFKELNDDLSLTLPTHGDLSAWAAQGVLLLNATLTVEAGKPGSHQGIGWEQFTNAVIERLSKKRQGLIFLLWGRFAGEKASLIDRSKHHILTAAHPSPFSAHRGFLGCKHFSEANKLLAKAGKQEINWTIV